MIEFLGSFPLGKGEQYLDEEMQKFNVAQCSKVIFDLTNLYHIDDSPLGCLLKWYVKVRRAGSQVQFVCSHKDREWPGLVISSWGVEITSSVDEALQHLAVANPK